MKRSNMKRRLLTGLLCMVLIGGDIMSSGVRVYAVDMPVGQNADDADINAEDDKNKTDTASGEKTDDSAEDAGTDNASGEDMSGSSGGETEDGKEENDGEKNEGEDGASQGEDSGGENENGDNESSPSGEGSESAEDDGVNTDSEGEENNEGNVDADEEFVVNAEERLALMTSDGDIASGTYGNVAWVIDANGELTVSGTGNYTTSNAKQSPWYDYRESIISAVIDITGIRYTDDMFHGCSKMTSVDLSKLDTSEVCDMSCMFYDCSSLTELDLSKFNTANVQDMNMMFYNCESLITLNLDGFDTSNVSNMNYMFYNCESLTALNISHFNTSNVISMSDMFGACYNLTTLDISHFDTSNVYDMSGMFSGCFRVTTLDMSHFDTSKVTNMQSMFSSCYSLSTLDVTNFDTGSVRNMGHMFYNCSGLSTLDVSNFDTSKVTNMQSMFSDCAGLLSLNLSQFITSEVTDMGGMFLNCRSLTVLNIDNFNTVNVTDMQNMFSRCYSLIKINVNHFDTSKVINMQSMFSDCTSLLELDLSSFDMQNVKDVTRMLVDYYWSPNAIYNLTTIYTPSNLTQSVELPINTGDIWYRSDGTQVTELPQNLSYSVALGKNRIPTEKVPESPITELTKDTCSILVYDESTKEPIQNASVIIDGISYLTDSEGKASLTAADESVKKQITVKASRYNDALTYQYIKNKDVIRIGLELSTNELQIVSASASLKNESYDLLREKLVLGYAEDMSNFTNVTKDTLTINVASNKNNVSYEILSTSVYLPGLGIDAGADEKVLFTSNNGNFSIDVATEIVKVGDIEIARTAVSDIITPIKIILIRVTDEVGNSVVKKLNLSSTYNYITQENTHQKDSFKLGDELRVSVPDEVPFIGGNDYVFGFDDKMPVEIEIDEDGKIKISYNKPADIDMDKFCKEYKDLEKKAGRVAKLNSNIAGTKKFSAGMFDVSGKVCGYGEGNISEIMDGKANIKLGIMAEIEGEAGYKHYWVIGYVPVNLFVEGKAKGELAFEVGMKFEGLKIKEFDMSGGSMNVTIQLEAGAGIGFGYEVEASVTGKINYTAKPARKYEKLWLEVSGKVKRVIIGIWEKAFWESDNYQYTLYQKGNDTPRPLADAEALYNSETANEELSLIGRTYLNHTNGYNSMEIAAYSSDRENSNSIVKAAVLPTAHPTLLEIDNVKYLFWLDDMASRDEYNRTALMYAKSNDGVNWSTPKQLIDESEDNTLDGAYDVFVDGDIIYLTWQDAVRELTEKDDVLDVLKALSIRSAVFDIKEDAVTENKCLTSESGYYMYPCSVAAGNEVYSAYVHNILDTGDIDGNNKQYLYVVDKDGESKAVNIPDKAKIVNMDAGIFNGNACLVCELDTDGDSFTDTDREIYIYNFRSDNMQRITNNEVIDTMPAIADSGNIYWFQNTNIVKFSESGKAPEPIWSEPQIAYQTVFTIATDTSGKDTILWETVDKDAEDGSVAIFQTNENADGTWGNVVKFAETTGTIASGISAAGSSNNLLVAHTEGVYLADGTALKDLCVTARENVVDIALTSVDFDEEGAAAGSPLALKAEIINNGNTVVDNISVSINDTAITTMNGLNLKPYESRELEISGFNVPSDLKKSTYFTLRMTAIGESIQEDNEIDFLIGCPDVYVETDSRIEVEKTWLDVNIWNNNPYEAAGEVLVHKGTDDGEVIYRKAYSGLGADKGYAYSVDLGSHEDKSVKYYVEVTSDNEENSIGNNTEFVYIGYGTGIEEEEENHETQEIEYISLDNRELSLAIGEAVQLTAKDNQGNSFARGELLWSSSDNRIASVDQTGLVKAHRLGHAEITVYYGELSCSCSVSVGEESETQTFTVWFDTQGGDEIEPVTGIIPGSVINLPTNTRKLGYIFEGWYTQPTGGEKIEDLQFIVKRSITLYAHWISGQSESGMWIEDIENQVYTGKAIKPQVKVYDGTKLLKEKTDYTISYKNNIKANDASNTTKAPAVIVKGKGNYSGKETATFKILPIDLNDTSVITEDITVAPNNKLQKKVPVLTYNGKKLVNKKDFTISYPALEQGVAGAYQAVGTYDILLTAKEGGNFTGTRTVKLIITDSTLISKAKVSKISAQYYLGTAIEPYFTVTYNDAMLVENEDYTFTYENNIAPGKAAIIIKGIGDYAGTKKVYFTIKGPAFKNVTVDGIVNKVYNGSKQEQQFYVSLDNIILTEGVDYEVEYSNNQNVGKAVVTIKGINAYSGTAKKTFKITAYDIRIDEADEISGFENEITTKYTKGGAKPSPAPALTFAGKKLVEGKDYTVSYKNNKAMTTGETQQLPTITIKGKGNFKGTLSKTFTIISRSLDDNDVSVTLTVADKGFVNKAGGYMSTPILIDSDGKKLIAGKDYEKEIIYSLEDGTPLTNESIVEAGTNIKVSVTGKGAYYGTLEKTYRITEYDFSKAKIKITPKVYTGSPITLDKNDITVRIGTDMLTYGTDYEIVEDSYTKNINKGTASVTIIGKGSYGGTKTAKFKITTKGFVWFWRVI